jgi:hypothetical protein
LPWVEEGGGTGIQVAKSYLPMVIVLWKSEVVDHPRDLFFLGWWALYFSLEWWGTSQNALKQGPGNRLAHRHSLVSHWYLLTYKG